MTDTANNNTDNQNSQSPDDKDTLIANLTNQLDALRGKTEELLGETKKAKAKAREESEAKEQARLEKAKKDGDFEKLLQSSERERKTLSERLGELENRISTEKLKSESMRLATELADGSNAELLSEFIQKRLKYSDDNIQVLDSKGELTVSSTEDLKREFSTNDKFKALLRGSKATGGGALGSGNSVATNNTMSRADYNSMDPVKQGDFMRKGGSVKD
jgi:predicted RNase H-like nuclease (RuvC/YqgF family)